MSSKLADRSRDHFTDSRKIGRRGEQRKIRRPGEQASSSTARSGMLGSWRATVRDMAPVPRGPWGSIGCTRRTGGRASSAAARCRSIARASAARLTSSSGGCVTAAPGKGLSARVPASPRRRAAAGEPPTRATSCSQGWRASFSRPSGVRPRRASGSWCSIRPGWRASPSDRCACGGEFGLDGPLDAPAASPCVRPARVAARCATQATAREVRRFLVFAGGFARPSRLEQSTRGPPCTQRQRSRGARPKPAAGATIRGMQGPLDPCAVNEPPRALRQRLFPPQGAAVRVQLRRKGQECSKEMPETGRRMRPSRGCVGAAAD